MKRDAIIIPVGITIWWIANGYIAWELESASKVYGLVLLPSLWLAMFSDWKNIGLGILVLASLPAMPIIGVIVYRLKMKPQRALLHLLVVTTALWLVLLGILSGGTDVRLPYARLAWLFCSGAAAPLALPIFALGDKMLRRFN